MTFHDTCFSSSRKISLRFIMDLKGIMNNRRSMKKKFNKGEKMIFLLKYFHVKNTN